METCDVLYFSDKVFENLIFIPVIVNGIEATALFDTGAGMSFVSKSIVEQFGELRMKSSVTGGNNQGITNSYQTICVDSIQIGNTIWKEQTVGILPDEALDFGEDSQHNRFPASMLLGWDLISMLCWEMDMNKRMVRMYPGGTMPKNNSLSWDSFPIINMNHAGSDYPMGFDSGHTDSFLDDTWTIRLGDLKEAGAVIHGVGSVSEEEVKIVDEFSFAINKTDLTLYQIEIVQHPVYGAAGHQICGLFGVDIVCGAKWVIDYQSRYFAISNIVEKE